MPGDIPPPLDLAAQAVGSAFACVVALSVTFVAAGVALRAAGFSSYGPVAGSRGARWMSATARANGGAVAAGSLFSAVQRAAMTLPFFVPLVFVIACLLLLQPRE